MIFMIPGVDVRLMLLSSGEGSYETKPAVGDYCSDDSVALVLFRVNLLRNACKSVGRDWSVLVSFDQSICLKTFYDVNKSFLNATSRFKEQPTRCGTGNCLASVNHTVWSKTCDSRKRAFSSYLLLIKCSNSQRQYTTAEE